MASAESVAMTKKGRSPMLRSITASQMLRPSPAFLSQVRLLQQEERTASPGARVEVSVEEGQADGRIDGCLSLVHVAAPPSEHARLHVDRARAPLLVSTQPACVSRV